MYSYTLVDFEAQARYLCASLKVSLILNASFRCIHVVLRPVVAKLWSVFSATHVFIDKLIIYLQGIFLCLTQLLVL